MLVASGVLDPSPPTPVAPTGPHPGALVRLDAVVAELDRTRAAVLAGPGAVTAAATALDGADEASATGNRELAAGARASARAAVTRVAPALAAAAGELAAYRASLAALAPVAQRLQPAQEQLLAAAALAGEREAVAHETLARTAREVWPAFVRLDEVQALWLERAAKGWYRDRAEAAAAYAVLRDPVGADVEQARARLAMADQARRAATEQMGGALRTADTALAPLRSAGPG